jgi:hypothetical protein
MMAAMTITGVTASITIQPSCANNDAKQISPRNRIAPTIPIISSTK